MRINVYSQELTDEVVKISKESNTGRVYEAVQLILHSSHKLHHPPMDDDRSAVTFWFPTSIERRYKIANAFRKMADLFDDSATHQLEIKHRIKATAMINTFLICCMILPLLFIVIRMWIFK